MRYREAVSQSSRDLGSSFAASACAPKAPEMTARAAPSAPRKIQFTSHLPEPPHGGDLLLGDQQGVVLFPDPQHGRPLDVVVLRAASLAVAMDVHVVEDDPPVGLV